MTQIESNKSAEFVQGLAARRREATNRGESFTVSNPYSSGTQQSKDWLEGYATWDADEDFKAAIKTLTVPLDNLAKQYGHRVMTYMLSQILGNQVATLHGVGAQTFTLDGGDVQGDIAVNIKTSRLARK